MTTFNSYGEVPQHRQTEVFDGLRSKPSEVNSNSLVELAKAVLSQSASLE